MSEEPGNYELNGQLIYVAGPYSADTPEEIQANVDRAIRVGVHLMVMGHYPVIPHLTYYTDEMAQELGVEFGYDDWMELDEAQLKQCDAIYMIEDSPGANQERELAQDMDLDVYEDIFEVPDVDSDSGSAFETMGPEEVLEKSSSAEEL